MNVLILGAAGFIGSALALKLTQRGDAVLGIDTRYPSSSHPATAVLQARPNFAFHVSDSDEAPFDALDAFGAVDAVVNAAGPNPWSLTSYPSVQSTATFDAFFEALNLADTAGAALVVNVGSAEVRGASAPSPHAMNDPTTFFGAAANFVETFGRTWSAQVRSRSFVSLRLPLVYGPRESPGSPIRALFEAALDYRDGKRDELRLPVPGPSYRSVDPIHVQDVTALLLATLDGVLGENHAGAAGRPVGFVTVNPSSVAAFANPPALAALVVESLGLDARSLQVFPAFVTVDGRSVDLDERSLELSEALRPQIPDFLAGWTREVSLDDGIRSAAPHYVNARRGLPDPEPEPAPEPEAPIPTPRTDTAPKKKRAKKG